MSPDLSAALALAAVALVGAAGYAFSLWLHPERNCPRCEGAGKHYGAVFRRARRQCRRCGGTGRVARLGTLAWERIARGRPSRYRSA